jgi:hypothetical protein
VKRDVTLKGLARAIKLDALWRCRRAATVAEYALVAIVIVTASGAVESPRFQTIKNGGCADGAACFTKAKPLRQLAARESLPSNRFAHRPNSPVDQAQAVGPTKTPAATKIPAIAAGTRVEQRHSR